MNYFDVAITFTLKWEGGYVNDPVDPGGETKYGISKRSYPSEDIKNLTLTRAKEIYYNDYWLRSGCEGLSYPLNICVFDTAVLCGVTRARTWLVESNYDWRKFLEFRMVFHLNSKLNKFKNGWINRVNDLKKYIDISRDSLKLDWNLKGGG